MRAPIHSRAQEMVSALLDEYMAEPMPPKIKFDDKEDETEFYTRSAFSAWERALDVGHRPELFAAVKGTVYEPMYRNKFNVDESKLVRMLAEDSPWSDTWEPTPEILSWFKMLLNNLNEGAIWTMPGTGQCYKVSHAKKTFTLISDNPNDKDHWHDKNTKVLAKFGYSMVVPGKDTPGQLAFAESGSPFTKDEVTLQYRPFQHGDGWKWFWVLLPEDGSRALATGASDSREQASMAARSSARKLGVTIGSVSVINPS